MNVEVLAALGVGIALGYVAKFWRLPGGTLVWAMLGSSAVATAFGQLQLGPELRAATQIVLGSVLGSALTLSTLTRFWRMAVPGVIVIGTTILAGVCTGLTLAAVTGLPLGTALLSTAPGGIQDMTITAVALGADVQVVAAAHVLRTSLINFVLPVAIPWLLARGKPHPHQGE